MICDLGRDLLYSAVSKYADDTKNTAKIGSTDDSTKFQKELDNIVYPWAPKNNMCLNGDKFEHHRIGNNLGIEKHIYKDPLKWYIATEKAWMIVIVLFYY